MAAKDPMSKLNTLCKKVLGFTDEEIASIDSDIQDQLNFAHPLKMAKQAKFNKLGNHNQKVMIAFKELRRVLIEGADVHSKE